jgi:hypothetical protein
MLYHDTKCSYTEYIYIYHAVKFTNHTLAQKSLGNESPIVHAWIGEENHGYKRREYIIIDI